MSLNQSSPFFRKCLYCGNEFEATHGNRNYCPPDNINPAKRDCKITCNNLKAQVIRQTLHKKSIPKIENFKILDRLYSSSQFIVDGKELFELGFKMAENTKVCVVENERIPIFVQYKLLSLGSNKFKIEYYEGFGRTVSGAI